MNTQNLKLWTRQRTTPEDPLGKKWVISLKADPNNEKEVNALIAAQRAAEKTGGETLITQDVIIQTKIIPKGEET